jgi:cysteinyl-tRNA synthetase
VREANAAIDREGATPEAREAALAMFNRVTGVLQIVPGSRIGDGDEHLMTWAKEMAEERKRAKWARDFGKADEIRKAMLARGVEVRDTKDGNYELKKVSATP